MKYSKILVLIFTLLTAIICKAQKVLVASDFYSNIKKYNLSKVIRPDSIGDFTDGNFEYTDPFGFIDTTYQRFFIHITTIRKRALNPYQYVIRGKIKVDDSIFDFKGSIEIIAANTEIIPEYDLPGWKEGQFASNITIYEDKKKGQSGYITGQLQTSFLIDTNNNIQYDAVMLVADGYSNNQFTGTWISYKTEKSKKCNWGDFRIPDCGDLDEGAGEFIPSEKYLDRGWRNLRQIQIGYGNDENFIAAEKKENERWWK